MLYISSVYGNRYAALLAVFLWSLHKNCPKARALIYWQDIDDEIIEALAQVFPFARYKKTYYNIEGDIAQRISSKTHLWAQAVADHLGAKLCLMDSDMLVARSPFPLWDEDVDIVFTDKDEQFQINTGIMLVRSTAAVSCFFQKWLQRTLEIINNPKLLAEAVSSENHYGAADQMSFYEMLDYDPCRKTYTIATDQGAVRLKAVPCSVLNETNSVPLSAEKYIYHYKGGWRPILFEGTFPPYRSEADSLPMYIQYLKYHSEMLRHLNQCGVPKRIQKNLALKIPRYFSVENGHFSKAAYVWSSCMKKINTFFLRNA